MRYRIKLTNMLTGEKNRAQNCLTVSNLKLDDVFSDVFGKSSRSIIQHILDHPGQQFDAEPYPHQLELIRTVPGFSAAPLTAVALISEISVDMSVFPSAKHMVSRAGCYLKPLLVQVADAVIKSDKYPECRERYRRIRACRGHKKAIIAVCRMLLTAIWNVLSKLELYSAKGYPTDKISEHSVVISKAQGLELLRERGYIFTDEVNIPAVT